MNNTTSIRQVLTAATSTTSSTAVEHRLASDAALVIVWDGSSRLMDVSGECYGLPALSTMLLETALREGMAAAVHKVSSHYDVPAERVRADLDAFLGDLLRRGLLTRTGTDSDRGGLWHRLKAWHVAGALSFILRAIRSDYRQAKSLLACACVSLKALGWARTVELWQTASAARLESVHPSAEPARADSIDGAVREAVSRSVFPVDCKARALCCWAMLRSAHLPARLIVGIDLFPFLGHCWCESESRILGDGSSKCGRFTPVLQYS